jgi:hypothetical protein
MQRNMWVESEVAEESKFFFTITSQISHSTMEATSSKMAPFANRTIFFVDTLFDTMGAIESNVGSEVSVTHCNTTLAHVRQTNQHIFQPLFLISH